MSKIKFHISHPKIEGLFGHQLFTNNLIESNFFTDDEITRIREANNKYFEYVDNGNDCDFILISSDQKGKLSRFRNTFDKKCVIFYPWDDGFIYENKDVNNIIFKRSLYKNRGVNEYVYPAFPHSDWIANKKDFSIKLLNKKEKPSIGFCGKITHRLRRTAIKSIDVNRIDKNIILRQKFLGAEHSFEVARKQYVENIEKSDFGLCVRGAGNFSYRLYETMSLGRIPIIIDDNTLYPAEDINWINDFIFIDKKDIHQINERVLEFYNSKTNEEWIELQKHTHRVWYEYLSPFNFQKEIYNILKKHI